MTNSRKPRCKTVRMQQVQETTVSKFNRCVLCYYVLMENNIMESRYIRPKMMSLDVFIDLTFLLKETPV